MTPRCATTLALIGVLLAGIPLPALTLARRGETAPVAPVAAAPRSSRPVYATLHWSGHPTELRLLHEGRELLCLSGESLATSPWEGEWALPATSSLDIEVLATWTEGKQAEAVSLTLEPEGQPGQQRTHWAEPGSGSLHNLFSFLW